MLNYTTSSTVTEVSGKKRAAVPLQVTVQPAEMHRTPKGIFPCFLCDKQYTQPQGVLRHQREQHGKKSLCPNCNDFRWNRRYQLAKHLKERHPGIDLDATLDNVTKCRREAAMNKKHLRQQQASPAECDRMSHGEFPIGYDLHPERAEKTVTLCKREDDRGLDLFGLDTNAPSASSAIEERLQPVNDAGISGQIWLAYPFLVAT